MAALICIKMVCGTFFVLGNIDNHFLHIFYNLKTLIRSIFPGGAGGPHLPTRLLGTWHRLDFAIGAGDLIW